MDNKKKKWIVTPFQKGDEARLEPLYKAIQGRFNLEEWQWKYLELPAKREGVFIDLAVDGDNIAGQYAIQPRYFWYNGKKVLAASSLDTYTHPDYRNQGIFVTLASSLYLRLKEYGFCFVYGFPNKNSRYGFLNKLGWQCILPGFHCITPITIITNETSPLNRATQKFFGVSRSFYNSTLRLLTRRHTANISVREITEPSEQTNSLFEKVANTTTLTAWHDREFLHWRYTTSTRRYYQFEAIDSSGRLLGYMATNNIKSHGARLISILELMVEPNNWKALVALIQVAIELAVSNGIGFIEIFCPKNRWESLYLHSLGFVRIPDKLFHDNQVKGALSFNPTAPKPSELYDSHNWVIQLGDADHT